MSSTPSIPLIPAGEQPTTRPGTALPRLAVLAAAVLWGTTGTAQALGPDGVDPVAVGYTRLLTGALVLLAATAATQWRVLLACLAPARRRWVLIAGVAVGGYSVAFFAGVANAGVAVGTLVALGSAPVFTGFFAVWLMRERFERGWRLATLLAVAGCALILLPGASAKVDPLGVGLTLTAGLCYGLYTVSLKRLLGEGIATLPALTATLAAGTVVLTLVAVPYLLATSANLGALGSPAGVVMICWQGVVTMAGAYLLFTTGLGRVPAASVGTLALAEPLVAATLGITLVGERPTVGAALGGLLLLAGLILLTVRRATPTT